jgi:hypothetical protein
MPREVMPKAYTINPFSSLIPILRTLKFLRHKLNIAWPLVTIFRKLSIYEYIMPHEVIPKAYTINSLSSLIPTLRTSAYVKNRGSTQPVPPSLHSLVLNWLSYQIFWEAVDLERDTLSLVSTIEVLLGRNRSGSWLETENKAVSTRYHSIRKSWH